MTVGEESYGAELERVAIAELWPKRSSSQTARRQVSADSAGEPEHRVWSN